MAATVGERLEASLRVRNLDQSISPDEFATKIESKSNPAVFRGVVKTWKANSLWDPSNGGLDYLSEKVGSSAVVYAMMSNDAHIFYGDLRNHETVALPFSDFIASCKSYLEGLNLLNVFGHVPNSSKDKTINEETCSTSLEALETLYLAQVPIYSSERKERCSLEALKEDIQTPVFLGNKSLASINFWMNRAHSRSSTHYDPHHNILCLVAGRKEVTLWPPSACRLLYPMPVYGEASNHSAVSLENPDLSVHARAKYMKEYSEKIILNPGDALFIPEGWFHQVDSTDLTVAVNFWWISSFMANMIGEQGHGQKRMLLKRPILCLSKEELGQIDEASEGCEESNVNEKSTNSGGNQDNSTMLGRLEPYALDSLRKLISLIHKNVKNIGQVQYRPTELNYESSETSNQAKHIASDGNAPDLVHESLAQILVSLEPFALQKILLAMVEHFPRTLKALILHMLEPATAEVLTCKFDETELHLTKEQQEEFYKKFYSVFDDPVVAMDAILNAKETFAFQAFQNVLDEYVGARVHPT